MQINVTTEIHDLADAPIQNEKHEPVTLRDVLAQALTATAPGEQLQGATSLARFNLALRVQGAEAEVEFSVDELADTKAHVGKVCPPLIAGRVWHLLDPTTKAGAP